MLSQVKSTKRTFNVKEIRKDFAILNQKINNKPLIYFDNAASTQKPEAMIEATSYFLRNDYANVHRGIHTLSQRSTTAFEDSRKTVAQFINAESDSNIVFVRGVTEAINLLSHGLSKQLSEGDEIIISHQEHHSNIVPWQMLAKRTGAILKAIRINQKGELDLEHYKTLLSSKTKIVSLVHISNALGTINPIKDICALAKEHHAITIIDGAQAVAHESINVQDLDCDFYAFSGHKLYGPTGIGVLYGKTEALNLSLIHI